MTEQIMIKNQYGIFPKYIVPKEDLKNLYINRGLTQRQVAEKLGVSHELIRARMKKFGIEARSYKGIKVGGVPRKFFGTKDDLEQLYYDEGLTTSEIASHYKVGRRTLEDWMHRLGIRIKTRSERVSGIKNPFYGRHHSEKTKRKIALKHRGKFWRDDNNRVQKHRENVLNRWANPDYRERNLQALRVSWKQKPTKLEKRFEELCDLHKIPLVYVGDGRFSVNGFNPDFIHSQGKKIAVDVFGDYWHDPKQRQDIPSYMLESNRKAIFQRYGWKLIVIWEHELSSPNNIVNQLRSVIKN